MVAVSQNLSEIAERTLAFLDKACKALDIFVYVYVAAKNPKGPEVISYGKWVGRPLSAGLKSKAPRYAPLKGLEVMAVDLEPGKLVVSPVSGSSLNLMGGARYVNDIVDMTVGVSKLSQQHDQLLAVIALYSAVFPTPIVGFSEVDGIFLHHAGFRYSTSTEFEFAANNASGKMLIRPASDHKRIYVAMPAFYREYQFFPDGPKDYGRHLDFVARDPRHFLQFVASAYDDAPTFWPEEQHSPIGAFWTLGDDSPDPMGVMARAEWWNVENS